VTRSRPLHYRNNIAHDRGRYYVRKMIGGRVVQRAFPTKRAATMFVEHLVLEAAGVYLAEFVPTLTEATDEYVRELKRLDRSPHTVAYYGLRRKPLDAALGATPLDRITQAAINEYVEARQTEVGNGTINKEITALKTIFTAAGINQRWRLKKLSHRPKRKRVHPPAVVRGLWDRLSTPTRCAVGLCLFAGFRAEEVLRAHASWVHGEEIDCEMEKSGGDTNRTWLVKTMRDILPKRGNLVTVSKNVIRHELEDLSIELKIDPPYRGPGSFRGHCSTYAADLGFARDEIKLVLGHQFGDVTDRYIHSQQIAKKRKLLEAVEKHVFGTYNLVTVDDKDRSNVVTFGKIAQHTESSVKP
jgi:hypothetical protein